MADKIQIRRDTAANWTSANPVLAQGELALETDTSKLKAGDGTTAWSSLAYYTLGVSGVPAASITGTLSQSQLANEAVNEAKLQVSNAPTNGYVLSAQSGNTGGMTWAEASSGHWTSLAEVTLGTSVVSGIDITMPTGYDVHKLEIRFPVCVGSTSRKLFMNLLNSASASLMYSYNSQFFQTNQNPQQYGSRFGTGFYMSPSYGSNSTDYVFYNLYFFNLKSTTNYSMFQGQGNSYDNTNAYGSQMLTSGIEYGTTPTAATSVVHFELENTTNFAVDDGCYYRLYGHSYS